MPLGSRSETRPEDPFFGPKGAGVTCPPPPVSGIHNVGLDEEAVLPTGAGSKSFLELYREHFAYVWKSARRLGVSQGEADDVVQETFLTVHRLLETYEHQGSERSWLFSVLFRIVQRHHRSNRRRTALTEDGTNVDLEAVAGPSASAPDRSAETKETIRTLEEILDSLDPEKRAVLVLAEFEEKPIAEIAEIVGTNINTAASRLRLAREHVEAAMARHRARDGWRYK
ncbi:MAG: polymerase sigma factor RpoE [Labilithrix sp.]|nr:polymerase sigma factor RpoE [Labilithrix sp.]